MVISSLLEYEKPDFSTRYYFAFIPHFPPDTESLSKPRRRRQRERQTKVLMRKTMAVHVRCKSCTFFRRPLQNKNVK